MDPRDELFRGIALSREVDDDLPPVDRRRYCQPTTVQFITLSIHPGKFTTRCDDRHAVHGELF